MDAKMFSHLAGIAFALLLILSLAPIPVYAEERPFYQEHRPVESDIAVVAAPYVNAGIRPIQYGSVAGQRVNIVFSAEKAVYLHDTTMVMEIILPGGLRLVTGDTNYAGKDNKKELSIVVEAAGEGDYEIEGRLAMEGDAYRNKNSMVLLVRHDLDALRGLKSAGEAQPSANAEYGLIQNANHGTNNSESVPVNYAHIKAVACTYAFANGNKYPLKGLQMCLLDESHNINSVIKTVYTVEDSADADYSLTPTNYIDSGNNWHHPDDSAGLFDFGNIYVGSGRSLYIAMVYVFHDGGDGSSTGGTEKLVIRDKNQSGYPIVYSISDAIYFGSGTTSSGCIWSLPLSSSNGSLMDEACHIYFDIVKTYQYFKRLVGYRCNDITAYINYPSTESPNSSGSYIDYNGWTDDYLTYQLTDSLVHEYAHCIQYSMYGSRFPQRLPGDANHGNHANISSSDAVIEGWARFVPTVVNKDANYQWGSTESPWNINNETSCSVCHHCDRDEWVFGAVLWDIRGDIGGGSHDWFNKIAQTFLTSQPNLVRGFYSKFCNQNNTYYSQIRNVFINHGINYDFPARSYELCIFRTGSATWYVDINGSGVYDAGDFWYGPFGQQAGDRPVAIDWDGDGTQEMAVFRPSTAMWYIDTNHNGKYDAGEPQMGPFGRQPGDTPLAIDWDGDGRQEMAIFRPGGTWFIDLNRNGIFDAGDVQLGPFGSQAGDIPIAIDWDGDGKRQELAIFRPSTATWYIDLNHNGTFGSGDISYGPFGSQPGDIPLALDLNGDGRQELTIFRPSTATWFIDIDQNGKFGNPLDIQKGPFGQSSGDIPLGINGRFSL